MSDTQNTETTSETTVSQPMTTEDPSIIPENMSKDEAPTDVEAKPEPEPEPQEITTEDPPKNEIAAAEDKTESVPAEKIIQPISEGQLTYKGPGLLKFLIPSKKEFWLTDESISQQELGSYLRGEKPEIAHPVVAWASQTSKGLLFFNKKGDPNHKQPGHVLPLYDATDLKKQGQLEITFKVGSQEHTLKAASETERDGWYLSIEKAVELGKASKDEIHESEGYKEELEKLNKPNVTAAVAAAASKRSRSQPKKSSEVERADSDAVIEEKKKNKSRSTSRGVLNRFKGKKDEPEVKKEGEGLDKEEPKHEEVPTTDEVAAVAAGTSIAGAFGIATAEVTSTDEEKKDSDESPIEASKTEEKAKPAKRGSIFGKLPGWGGVKTPTKEKEMELKPEVPPKDGNVSEDPPVLPETATTERTDAEAEANKIETKAEKEVAKENQKDEVLTPSKEKTGFLSGLIPKRTRSISPSANLIKSESEAPKETVEEPVKAEEAPTETIPVDSTDKVEEPVKTETPTANKRQSVLGSLGRRASKAVSGRRGQKKENVAPASENKEESTEVASGVETPAVNGEVRPASSEQPIIGDVVPSAISVGQTEQPRTVTASA